MTNKFPSTLPREWAILPDALRSFVSEVERHLAHSADAPALAAFPGAGLGTPDEAPYELDGSVAIVPVQGTLTKKGFSFFGIKFTEGMRDIAASLRRAASDHRVKSIMLDVDSPGGTVDGTEELAEAVAEVAAVKPVYAWCDGLMASAAYWISCGAKEIAASATSKVGSIGVIRLHREVSAALEKAGVTFNIIAAGHFKAAGNDVEPLSEEMRAYLQHSVDSAYDLFLTAVEKGRRVNREKALTMADGKVFSGGEALAIGLIDRVCSRSDFLKHIKKGDSMNPAELKAQYPDAVAQIRAEAVAEHESELASAREEARADGMKEGEERERARMVALAAAAIGEEASATLSELASSGMTPEQLAMAKKVIGSSGSRLSEMREAHSGNRVEQKGLREEASFDTLVKDHMAKTNCGRGEAVRAMAAAHPEAHTAWLESLKG